MVGSVDQDIHLRADRSGKCGDRSRIGEIEGNGRDVVRRAQQGTAVKRFTRIGQPDMDGCGAGLQQGARQRRRRRMASVGDQDAPGPGIGGHFLPGGVFLHVRCLRCRSGKDHGLAGLVELQRQANPLALDTIAMQMDDDGRPAIGRDQPLSPGQVLAKIGIDACMDRGGGDEQAAFRRIDEFERRAQAFRAGIAGRIGEASTGGAALQGKASLGRRARQSVGGAASVCRRQRRRPRRRGLGRFGARQLRHCVSPHRITAPEDRPRS